jgi:cell division protein FtsB
MTLRDSASPSKMQNNSLKAEETFLRKFIRNLEIELEKFRNMID